MLSYNDFLKNLICARPLNSGEWLSNTFLILHYFPILQIAFKDTFAPCTISESPVVPPPPPQIKLD